MNRTEHLQQAKGRVLAELDADPDGRGPANALTSIMSDLRKHPDTAGHLGITDTGMLMFSGGLTTETEVREHVNGFN